MAQPFRCCGSCRYMPSMEPLLDWPIVNGRRLPFNDCRGTTPHLWGVLHQDCLQQRLCRVAVTCVCVPLARVLQRSPELLLVKAACQAAQDALAGCQALVLGLLHNRQQPARLAQLKRQRCSCPVVLSLRSMCWYDQLDCCLLQQRKPVVQRSARRMAWHHSS